MLEGTRTFVLKGNAAIMPSLEVGSVAEKGEMTERQANWCQCSRWKSGRREKASHHLHPESWAAIREDGGQGERHLADGLREAADNRRLTILAVCVVEWRARLADTVVDTHDRIVGGIWRDAKRLCDAGAGEARTAIHRTLCSFVDLGEALLGARDNPAELAPMARGPF